MSITTLIKRNGEAVLFCHECGKSGPAEEWAYGHDCEDN